MTTATPWSKALPSSARRLRVLAPVVSALATATFALPATASAEADFVAPNSLGALQTTLPELTALRATRTPHVAAAADGTAYAAWVAPATGGGKPMATLAVHAPGGSWTTEPIASATPVSGGVPLGIAADGTLTALVVDPDTKTLRALTRKPGTTFGGAQVISFVPGQFASLALDVNASGEAIAGWRQSTDAGPTLTNWTTWANHRGAAGWEGAGNFHAPAAFPTATLASGGTAPAWVDLDPVSATINDAGQYAIGTSLPTAGKARATSLTHTTGTSWSGLTPTPDVTGNTSRMTVDLSTSGALVASYLAADTGAAFENNTAMVMSVVPGAGAPAIDQLTSGGVFSPSSPTVRFGKSDDYTVAWTNTGGNATAGQVAVATGTAGQHNPTRAGLSTSGDAAALPRISTDASGNRFVAWTNATTNTIQGRFSAAGSGTFAPARTAPNVGTGDPFAPDVALDSQGNVATAWTRQQTDGSIVAQATGFDTAPPTLDQVLIPTSGTATLPLAFSAHATDVWSTPKLSWAFGDGATADGASATHAYGAANSYTATVTATDDVGNSASRDGSVAVAAKPVVLAAPVDADGDGVLSDRDCNDDDARVKPTAHDIPGNGVDENCDGKDAAYGALATTIRISYVQVKALKLTRLAVRGVRVGDRIKVRCSGPGCTRKPNVERRVKKVSKNAEYDLFDLVRRLRLRPSAELTIAVSRDEYTTRISRYKVRKGDEPVESLTCQLPGTKTTVACN